MTKGAEGGEAADAADTAETVGCGNGTPVDACSAAVPAAEDVAEPSPNPGAVPAPPLSARLMQRLSSSMRWPEPLSSRRRDGLSARPQHSEKEVTL